MLSTAFNFILIVLGFGVLIFVHELGHFLAARWAGIRTEAFAIGMGTAVFSWRKGVGFAWGSTHAKVVEKTGKSARDLSLEELEEYGLGPTEYSLRWLPIGGFVKMLGQDDADPNYVSTEPGSYNVCPIGKRMVVVSAGVAANILLAVALFIAAFMMGVRSEMAVVGGVLPAMPAATVAAVNAEAAGLPSGDVGLKPGDLITNINGKPVKTFTDVTIATAMSKPGERLTTRVQRPGASEPLEFQFVAEKDPTTGLLGIGIYPGRSNALFAEDKDGVVAGVLDDLGLAAAGIGPGWRLIEAQGQPIETYEQFLDGVGESGGRPIPTVWTAGPDRAPGTGRVEADVPVEPRYELLRYPQPIPDVELSVEEGLFGLTPLIRIGQVFDGRGSNRDVLRDGDVILRAGPVDGPRLGELMSELAQRKGGQIDLRLLRDGAEVQVTAQVDRKGKLNFYPEQAWDLPLVAQPMDRIRTAPDAKGESQVVSTPVAGWLLMGGTRIDAVNDTPVTDWPTLRAALRAHTRTANQMGAPADLSVTIINPTPEHERETRALALSADQVGRLHRLSWRSELPEGVFEPLYTTLSAHGNPLRAAAMGVQETHKVMVITYLTLDRLVRGSVGVEQIRGPVGIVHIGTKVADRGLTYLMVFLGIISVNLAVINFLPIPIVDGGLFLFLIYEKLKGKPPSLAFQNAATIIGVAMIATVLLVVTWNDLMRLVG